MNIPFLDLITPHMELEDELLAVVRKALRSAHFIGGEEVENFEKEWAAYCGAEYAIGVSSGTDALRFALMAAGVGKGDTVVTVPNTFIATTEAISQAGARIAFVDVDERTCNMDPQKLREYLRSHANVKAVIPVHLYGRMCDMDAILDVAEEHHCIVIEDACQAHGAQYFSRKRNHWVKAGSMGCAAAFSFYPGKNLGACGEAGAVTTNDPAIAGKIRMLRDHGQVRKYCHEFEGYNGRLDAIQAGFLRVKLRRLDEWNEMRRAAAARYGELLSGVEVPYEPEWSRSVYHLYEVRSARRDLLKTRLEEAGIGTGLHYPVPLHLQRAYALEPGSYPAAEKAAAELLSLPMFPGLTQEQQKQIAAVVNQSESPVISLPHPGAAGR